MNANEMLAWLYRLLGEVVLLPIPLGQKAPQRSGWHKTTYADTEKHDYQDGLIQAVKRGGNIGVLLGPASARLFALDLDYDELPDQWITRHPWLAHTLRTRGRRGCQFWLRLEAGSHYPNSKAVFRLAEGGQDIRELRLGGNGAHSPSFTVSIPLECLIKSSPTKLHAKLRFPILMNSRQVSSSVHPSKRTRQHSLTITTPRLPISRSGSANICTRASRQLAAKAVIRRPTALPATLSRASDWIEKPRSKRCVTTTKNASRLGPRKSYSTK
ncbi:MAG: bifunctional DNA primase/polymerase [Verrucomicrobia bacterium]|nr:bifunctional DNA primase/polymerase [Verrucomicrobiota bacterium]